MSTLFRTLRRLGITRKKVSRYALERNDEKRATFMNNLADTKNVPFPLAAANRRSFIVAFTVVVCQNHILLSRLLTLSFTYS